MCWRNQYTCTKCGTFWIANKVDADDICEMAIRRATVYNNTQTCGTGYSTTKKFPFPWMCKQCRNAEVRDREQQQPSPRPPVPPHQARDGAGRFLRPPHVMPSFETEQNYVAFCTQQGCTGAMARNWYWYCMGLWAGLT